MGSTSLLVDISLWVATFVNYLLHYLNFLFLYVISTWFVYQVSLRQLFSNAKITSVPRNTIPTAKLYSWTVKLPGAVDPVSNWRKTVRPCLGLQTIQGRSLLDSLQRTLCVHDPVCMDSNISSTLTIRQGRSFGPTQRWF
jgi:hypothetical protein